MARSKWKLSYFSHFLLKEIIILKKKKKDFKKKRIIYYDRSSTVPNCFVNISFRIHKGKFFRRFMLNIYNVGYKFGEFSFTRKPYHFPLKKTLKRKNILIRL